MCDSANTAGIVCKSEYSINKFLRDKIFTTGVFHNEVVVANNAYTLSPSAQITNQFTITDDTRTSHHFSDVQLNILNKAATTQYFFRFTTLHPFSNLVKLTTEPLLLYNHIFTLGSIG